MYATAADEPATSFKDALPSGMCFATNGLLMLSVRSVLLRFPIIHDTVLMTVQAFKAMTFARHIGAPSPSLLGLLDGVCHSHARR